MFNTAELRNRKSSSSSSAATEDGWIGIKVGDDNTIKVKELKEIKEIKKEKHICDASGNAVGNNFDHIFLVRIEVGRVLHA